MYGVELYVAVHLAVVDSGLSHREADRRFGIDRRTVKKMPSYSSPPGYRRTKPDRRPKPDGFTGWRGTTPIPRGAGSYGGERRDRPFSHANREPLPMPDRLFLATSPD